MTDLPIGYDHLPTRLGVTARRSTTSGASPAILTPVPALCDRGAIPIAVLVFLVDAVTGRPVDTDPDSWTFTSDLTVRAPLHPPPGEVLLDRDDACAEAGSSTSEAPILADGKVWGHCFAGFSRVPRRDGDPVEDAVRPGDGQPPDSAVPAARRTAAGRRWLPVARPRAPARSRSSSMPTC